MQVRATTLKLRSTRELLAMGAALAALALAVSASGVLTRIDHFVFDQAQRWAPEPAPHGVVIVSVDQASLQEIGRWPWSRQLQAQLLRRICASHPSAVALDMAFNEVGADAAANQALAQAVRSCAKVALPLLVESSRGGGQLLESPPIPELAQEAAGLGRVSVRLDDDGVARSVDLWEGVGSAAWPLLAQTVLELAQNKPITTAHSASPSTAPYNAFAIARSDLRLLRLAGPAGTIPSLSAATVLQSELPLSALQGKIVLVGATAAGLGDLLSTPLTTMPGVEVLANTVLNLRDDSFIVPLSRAWTLVLSALLALVPLFWSIRLMPLQGLLAALGWLLVLLSCSAALPIAFGIWFAPSGTLVAAFWAYPLWSWRRLESARRHLDWELQQLGGAARAASFRRLGFEQRIIHVQLAQRRFRDLQQQRDETLAFISHDIRAPLAQAAQQLAQGDLDAAAQRRLQRLLQRAHDFAQDFLALARAEKIEPSALVEIDLGAVVQQATDSVYALAQQQCVQLVREIADEPVWVRGNFDLLERACINLLRNALRFSPPGSRITVRLTGQRQQAELSISDQGPGVSPKALPHLFEKFGNSAAQAADPHSTGLGLYFVRSVALGHAAQTGYEALLPHGARFWLRLPQL